MVLTRARHIPNVLSIVRILLVFPIVWGLLDGWYLLSLWLTLVAGLTDALDGFLARQCAWRSRLGGMLDPAADKVLLVSVFIALAWQGLVPAWVTAVVVGRDVIIVSGTLYYHFRVDRVVASPTAVSKLNTFLQIAFALLTVTHAELGVPPEPVRWAVGVAMLLTIGVSVVQYVVMGVTRVRAARRRTPAGEGHGFAAHDASRS